jgi:hypothetical protein
MNRDSMNRLKHDKRLAGRRGWTTGEELQQEIDALPDSADKAVPLEGGPAGDAGSEPVADSKDN